MISRLPILDQPALSDEQWDVFESIPPGPRGVVEGPLRVWLQSPKMADAAQRLGTFCRYGTRLPGRLSELAINAVCAHCRSGFEWHVHAPIAAAQGIADDVIAAIRGSQKPVFLNLDERVVYGFSQELVETRQVSNKAYGAVIDSVGDEGTVELVAIVGYCTLICMTSNTFQVPVPDGASEPFALSP